VSTDLYDQLQQSLGDEYALERELGAGGMSRVFLAEEKRLGRRVVVKVLSPELAAGISVERFDREIRLAARLQDPRIVPLLRAGRLGDLPFYTMPYIEGESLRARLGGSALPVDEAIGILRDLALALEYAHARNVVHRDIKPENVLLSGSGRTAVVADFGIAKALAVAKQGDQIATDPSKATSPSTLTAAGTSLGTPAYMAPEQVTGDVVDPRADLYSWGVIAYEMLSGAHPFASHRTAQALMAAHIAEVPPPLASRRRDLPASLTAVVDQCLAKDPNARPANAAAVVAALNDAARSHDAPGFRVTRTLITQVAVALLLLAGLGGWWYVRSDHRRWAREEAIPESTKLADARRSLSALLVLQKAAGYLPADTQIAHATKAAARTATIASSPGGATVEIQDYRAPENSWYRLGTTPLDHVTIPNGYLRWRVSKAGVGEYISAPLPDDTIRFPLDSVAHAPAGMVWVGSRGWGNMIAFIGWVGGYRLPAFYIDKFEVTNRQYQEFVDSGGYRNKEYWTQPFTDGARTLTYEQAMVLLRDQTGRPGPSTWEGGHYPDGQADYPVSGVSWFEASAYAAYAKKSLPTFAQWFESAPDDVAPATVSMSNMSGSRSAPVGSFKGIGPYGTYDMAGNVREWVLNASNPADRRMILGGAWKSPTYLYSDPEALSPLDRSAENGFRCVRNLGPLPAAATRAVQRFERDFSKYTPASDEVFRAYRAMYNYPREGLNAKSEGVVAETKDWRQEKITVNAPNGAERMALYLFLPKRVQPPYQTVLFSPSARVLDLLDSKELGDVAFFDYIVQSGRAVLYPVYADTYERRFKRTLTGSAGDFGIVVERAKEVGRALDYLDTRSDIDRTRRGYLGVSMGSAEGVIYTTLAQDRLKAVVFLDGGYFLNKPPVGQDQADFAPRLTRPVLMVNGRYDFTFSLEKSQIPLFQTLGTPAADKRHLVLDTPHDVLARRPELVKAVIDWLDKYLGPVR
jgi:tRNA A-37 threonylcarbamoyl transferase component Bud32